MVVESVKKKEYVVEAEGINVYDSDQCTRLATQAWQGRHLLLNEAALPDPNVKPRLPLPAILLEDKYLGWLSPSDIPAIRPISESERYQATPLVWEQIQPRLGTVVSFSLAAGERPNEYLWGGTLGPDFDCSGLVQRAFASEGIWVPRDAYQQEAFTTSVALEEIQAGDLIFFGRGEKATHVGLCVGMDRGRVGRAVEDVADQSIEYDENVQCECRTKSLGSSSSASTEDLKLNKASLRQGGGGFDRVDDRAQPKVRYIHSSSKDYGHNGIRVDELSKEGSPVGVHYFEEFRGVGRVTRSL